MAQKIFFAIQTAVFNFESFDDLGVTDGVSGTSLDLGNPFTNLSGTTLVPVGHTLYAFGDNFLASDGTTAGTHEVAGSDQGLAHTEIGVNLDGTFFFRGTDIGDQTGTELWMSDGTAAGTRLAADINPGTGSSTPNDFEVVGDNLFFSADDGVHGREVWVANAAGVAQRLTDLFPGSGNGVQNSVFGGSGDPKDEGVASFNGEYIFSGGADSQSDGLFAINVAGELHEITGVGRVPGGATHFTIYQDFENGDQPLLFYIAPSNTAGQGGPISALWATDGTLTGEVGGDSGNQFFTSVSDMAQVGHVMVVSASSNTHHSAIWAYEKFGSADSFNEISDFDSNITPQLLTTSGDHVYFRVNDGTHGTELWMTDGTSAGTKLVADLNPNGDSNPLDLIDVKGELYFEAASDGSTYHLYKTDGTTTVQVAASAVDPAVRLAAVNTASHQPAPSDFNDDHKSDIYLIGALDPLSGAGVAVSEMSGTTVIGALDIDTPANPNIVGIGDFDGNGLADVALRDSAGTVTLLLNAGNVAANAQVGQTGNTAGWSAEKGGDFNGDGHQDLLWFDPNAGLGGSYVIWELNGGQIIDNDATIGTPGDQFRVVATGDFDGDGSSDILFQNQNDGSLETWFMNGTTIASHATWDAPSSSFTIVGTGDFNGDGMSDLLFRDASGALVTWDLDGTKIVGGGTLDISVGAFSFPQIGDYNGDGFSDLAIHNTANGGTDFTVYELNDTTIVGSGTVSFNPTPPQPYLSDFTGDGIDDLVFQQQSTSRTFFAAMPDGTLGPDILPPTPFAASLLHAAGVGDVNGDGTADVVYQVGSGAVYKGLGGLESFGPETFAIPDGWKVMAVGDVSGDGAADIVWADSSTGVTFDYDVKATEANPGGDPVVKNIASPGADFVVRGIGDINGDGVNDVVFQSTSTGTVIYSDMKAVAEHLAANNYTLTDTQHALLTSGIDPNIVVKGVGDIDHDGFADLVLESSFDLGNGQPPLSTLFATQRDAGGSLSLSVVLPDVAAFDVKGVTDVDGDHVGDIVMQYTQDLDFGLANLHGGVAVVDVPHDGHELSFGLVQSTLGLGGDFVLV